MEIVRAGKLDEGQKRAFEGAVNSLIVSTGAIVDLVPEGKKDSAISWLNLFAQSVMSVYQNQEGGKQGELEAEGSAMTKVELALRDLLSPIPTEKL